MTHTQSTIRLRPVEMAGIVLVCLLGIALDFFLGSHGHSAATAMTAGFAVAAVAIGSGYRLHRKRLATPTGEHLKPVETATARVHVPALPGLNPETVAPPAPAWGNPERPAAAETDTDTPQTPPATTRTATTAPLAAPTTGTPTHRTGLTHWPMPDPINETTVHREHPEPA